MLSEGGKIDEFEELYGVEYVVWSFTFSSLTSPCKFDPECFFRPRVLQTVRGRALQATPNSPGLYADQQSLVDGGSPISDFNTAPSQNPPLSKQAVIVLREELECFSVPSEANKTTPA